MAKFAEAHTNAMDALKKLENFTDTNLEVVLFSGEGDSLHQVWWSRKHVLKGFNDPLQGKNTHAHSLDAGVHAPQIFDCIMLGPMARVDFWDR